MQQKIRYVQTPGDIRIACATSGSGPPLVKAANWLNHLEYDWDSPVWRHWLNLFSSNHTFVRYDERGCGLSQRNIDGLDFEAFIEDLETVVDALELERFPLLGISQGGAIAIEYAARHPERVSHLILVGAYALGHSHWGDEAQHKTGAITELIRYGWGERTPAFRQAFSSLMIPDANEEELHSFAELQRVSATPEIAVAVVNVVTAIDVTRHLPLLDVPTLVAHANHDATVPRAQGELLASKIRGAQFLPLLSRNHVLIASEPAWAKFKASVCAFLGMDPPGEPDEDGPADVYRVGDFAIDVARREIRQHGEALAVQPKVFQLIAYLVENRERAVAKNELQDKLWPTSVVTESSLTRVVMKARRAFGDESNSQSVIRTVRGHGYRFVAPIGSGT